MRTTSLLGLWLVACKGGSDDGSGSSDGPPPGGTDAGSITDTGATGIDTDPEPNGNTTGGSERCVLLFGGNDRVRGPDEGLPLGSVARTMQAWVRTNSELEQIAVSYGRPSPEQGFMLGTEGGYPMVRAGMGSMRVVGDTWIADDQWHHLAAAFDGRLVVITLDGGTDAVGELVVDTLEGDLVAGNTPTGDLASPWVGWLDDVRIFGGARTTSEIADDPDGEAVEPDDLLLWWDFEIDADATGPGVVVPDQSGNGHDGTTGGAEGTPVFPACR